MSDIDHNTKTKQKIQMHGEVVRGADNIAKIGEVWDDLFARAQEAPAYLSRAWVSTFIDEGRFRGTPVVILVWYGRKLVGLFPLAVRKFLKLRLAKPIGTGEPSYLGILLDPDYSYVVECMADLITSTKVFDVYYTADLSSKDAATNDLLIRLAQKGYSFQQVFRNLCPYIQLGCSFDEYFTKCISSRSRHVLRRKERRLFESGDVKIEYYVGEEVTPEVVDRIATVQEQSWMKRRGAAVLSQPFFQKFSLKMAQIGFGCLWLMTIDGDDAAFQYAFIAHRKLYFRWTAFKLKYKSLSIGQSLMMHIIRDVCSNNILSIDLGHGDAEYKRFWATDNHNVERVVTGRGVLGYLIVLCYRAIWRLSENKWLFSLYRRFRKRRRSRVS